jgi:serine/threonine-protein kinase
MMARFAREARIAAELDHPNLVAVRDVALTDEGVLYLVMDLVEGASLDAERKRFGDVARMVPILAQVARGLAAMHARTIVHRDLKPGNVLVSEPAGAHPQIKIADFGIAALSHSDLDGTLAEGGAADLTRTGWIMGTLEYLAPELAHGVRGALPSSDMFSFGVLAYEVLTGSDPFVPPAAVARMEGRTISTPTPLRERCVRLELEVATLIQRCLHIDPRRRPTAEALAVALEGAVAHLAAR